MSDGFITSLLKGLAQLLETASIGTYRSDGTAYTTDNSETAIVIGTLPQSPDNAIALMSYPVSDHPALSDSVVGVQIRTRKTGQDVCQVTDLSDSIFSALHGLHDTALTTGTTVVQCMRNSGASLGQDRNNRWEWSDNYYLTVHRPSTNRT